MSDMNLGRRRMATGWDYVRLNRPLLLLGDKIIVKCISKPNDKNYFWGTSERIPGMKLTCEYTAKFRKDGTDVIEGIRYICSIKKINDGSDGGKACFVVKPIKVFSEDLAKFDATRELKNDTVGKTVSSAKNEVTEAPGGSDE